jgi:hypothetical protein
LNPEQAHLRVKANESKYVKIGRLEPAYDRNRLIPGHIYRWDHKIPSDSFYNDIDFFSQLLVEISMRDTLKMSNFKILSLQSRQIMDFAEQTFHFRILSQTL